MGALLINFDGLKKLNPEPEHCNPYGI